MVNLHKGSEENLNSKVRQYDFIQHMKNKCKHLEDAELQEQENGDEPRVIAMKKETVAEIMRSIQPIAFCLFLPGMVRQHFIAFPAFRMGSRD